VTETLHKDNLRFWEQGHYPEARWGGPVPNMVAGGMATPLMGVVMHRQQGTESGTDAWFHNPAAEVSAHFGVPTADKLGNPVPMDQWVKLTDRAWAEVAGNDKWISFEFAGYTTDELDANQIVQAASCYAWLHDVKPEWFPLRSTDSVNQRGLGWHGMGGDAWGGHFDCPGDKAKHRRPHILARALLAVHPMPAHTPHHSPHPEAPPYPGHLLEIGSHGPNVEKLTEHLKARGWRITPTSHYSKPVADVVRAFQSEKDLTVDGIVGPVTWHAIWHLPVTR
jgi:hypothetical protein